MACYLQPVGGDPHLQTVTGIMCKRLLTVFTAGVQSGVFSRDHMVRASSVSSMLTVIGMIVSFACHHNPTKITGSDKHVLHLQQGLDWWPKLDPPSAKKLPIKVDILEFLVSIAIANGRGPTEVAVGDLSLITFYCLLQVREYTVKQSHNNTKQRVQFVLCDNIFDLAPCGALPQVAPDAPASKIMTADGAKLHLENKKNGWKGLCIYHEHVALGFLVNNSYKFDNTQQTKPHFYWFTLSVAPGWTLQQRILVTP